MKHADRFEYATAKDPHYNYCLWDYAPVAPVQDKFRAVNLLLQSFDFAGIGGRGHEVIERVREGIGMFQTVFGIKFLGDRLAWEFYFYDYARRERRVSITKVLEAIRPLIPCGVPVNESLPYFMFSLDFDAEILEGRRAMDVVHMYVGNPGSTVSSGIAYAVRAEQTRLENFYFFFDARTQLEDAAGKITSSAYVDETVMDLDLILRPELRECRTICVANKQANDTVYFSQVDVDQLLFFLRLLEYPSALVDFVSNSRSDLDHLLYDVGFDYTTEGGRLNVVKSGYYGVF